MERKLAKSLELIYLKSLFIIKNYLLPRIISVRHIHIDLLF